MCWPPCVGLRLCGRQARKAGGIDVRYFGRVAACRIVSLAAEPRLPQSRDVEGE